MVKEEICAATNIKEWDNPGKYLSLPASWGQAKSYALKWIKERVLEKIYWVGKISFYQAPARKFSLNLFCRLFPLMPCL